MTIALHLPTRPIGTPVAPSSKRRLPLSAAIAAIGAAGAALAFALSAERPWTPTAPPHVPLPLPVSAAPNAVPAFALEVDWSRVEAAENPGPMAVAAYER